MTWREWAKQLLKKQQANETVIDDRLVLVVAGTYQQAVYYCSYHNIPRNRMKYVSGLSDVYSYSPESARVVLTGTYYRNRELRDITEVLASRGFDTRSITWDE